MDKDNLPKHIAIIMDGNGRWARQRGLPKIIGHRKGMDAVKRTIRSCINLGIKVLTLYAFSTENWQRTRKEVDGLMLLLGEFLNREEEELRQNNIRLNVIGKIEDLPDTILERLNKLTESTKNNKGLILNIALSYGGREEIVEATRRLSREILQKKIKPEDINEELFSNYLYTAGLPDPDLLIRTSGEMRLSNFLLWQTSYTELYVTKRLWPDFDEKELLNAIEDYQKRDRRFGK